MALGRDFSTNDRTKSPQTTEKWLEGTHVRENSNKFWFSSNLIVPLHIDSKNKRDMMQREWKEIRKFEEILFEEYHGIAKITINRAYYRNAFTPKTTLELSQIAR